MSPRERAALRAAILLWSERVADIVIVGGALAVIVGIAFGWLR